MRLRTTATKAWSLLGVVLLALTMLTQVGTPAAGAGTPTLPCDVFAAGGQTCVAAYSTVRALSSGYGGPLYQVTRQSDGTSTDIGLLGTGGYVNAATQDSFCANTVCTITRIYDQSGNHSDLTLGPAGSSGSSNIAARADALPVTVAGHEAYGIRFTPRVGYRYVPSTPNTPAPGMATNGQPESMYEVASGTDATDHCCSDFGNMEPSATDTGNGHMDAIIISTWCGVPPCSGQGPWVQADLENGVYMGNGSTSNPANVSENSKFITAVLRNNGQTQFALDGGDATRPTLTSLYSGSLPSNGYQPMHQEGGIGLGVGGDQSDMAPGAFFEGAITSGYASNSTVASVQSNIASVGYSGTSGGGPGVPVTGPGGTCLDVSGNDNGGDGTPVDIWSCQHDAVDQTWQYLRTTPDQGLPSGAAIPSWQYPEELVTMGRCLDIDGNGTAAGTKVELWDCNGVGGQQWVPQSNGTLLNPQSGLCLTSPGGSTTNGTVLDIETCTGSAAQRFLIAPGWLIQGQTISAPTGKCVGSPAGAAAVAGSAVALAAVA
ncbi:MAG: ricin-type beta-trefoil lectin domain protein, partial [Actinobacteria bacterium]|nr:ricin-type beta-trefoil lectin domain protein [Actinomycetota bacterium]